MAVDLLFELAPEAERLLERHLDNAKEWFPHEMVPWGQGRDYELGEVWCPEQASMDEGLRSALFVNLLTEDNLPHYFRTIRDSFGDDHAWGAWSKRWTAEEGRHSIVMRDYMMITRSVDPIALERGRMHQVSTGQVPEFSDPADAISYVAIQELATCISHRNTGRMIEDRRGREIMARVAGDEKLHYIFYRDIALAAIKLDPSTMVQAIARQVINFAMPGTAIPGFTAHSKAIAKAGIYNFAVHHDHILKPLVLESWAIESIEGLNAEAEQAREKLISHIERVGKAGVRSVARQEARAASLA